MAVPDVKGKQPAPSKATPAQTTTISGSQLAREDYLRGLGARPSLALADWKRLRRRNEDTLVTGFMLAIYGPEFVKHFLQVASRGADPVVHLHHQDHPILPKSLSAQGYKRLGIGYGGVQVWVHPDGDEYWVFPPSKWSTDPLVEILQRDVNKLVEFKTAEFPRMLRIVDGMKSTDVYEMHLHELSRQLDEFELNLKSVILQIPELNDGSVMARQLAEAKQKTDDLENWRKTARGKLADRAPPPQPPAEGPAEFPEGKWTIQDL